MMSILSYKHGYCLQDDYDNYTENKSNISNHVDHIYNEDSTYNDV